MCQPNSPSSLIILLTVLGAMLSIKAMARAL